MADLDFFLKSLIKQENLKTGKNLFSLINFENHSYSFLKYISQEAALPFKSKRWTYVLEYID